MTAKQSFLLGILGDQMEALNEIISAANDTDYKFWVHQKKMLREIIKEIENPTVYILTMKILSSGKDAEICGTFASKTAAQQYKTEMMRREDGMIEQNGDIVFEIIEQELEF